MVSKERVILHADMNNFYASVECMLNPKLKGYPVVVGGDAEARHGIILAKNYEAKKYGIQTGEALWQAKQKCKDLIIAPPNYEEYSIDRIRQITRACATKVGGTGIRYTVDILGTRTFLFEDDEGRWFVEAKSNAIHA